MKLEDEIIKEVIRGYTKESGVRNLEREISKLARKVVKKVVTGEEKEVTINNKNLSDFLGADLNALSFLAQPQLHKQCQQTDL